MIGTSSQLVSFDSSAFNSTIVLADGSTLSISGCGDVNLTSFLSFSSVLCVPKFHLSLLSISKLTKSLNSLVAFYPFVSFKTTK